MLVDGAGAVPARLAGVVPVRVYVAGSLAGAIVSPERFEAALLITALLPLAFNLVEPVSTFCALQVIFVLPPTGIS